MNTKILVVDDSNLDRLIIKKMLKDYEILTAVDGIEAIKIIKENLDISLMILDLNMPNMNGFEVLSTLSSDEKYKKIRTIILTNYDELDKEIKGLKLGAVDFIRKPVNLESLRIRIEIHAELLKTQSLLEKELSKSNLLVDTIFDQAPIGITLQYPCDSLSNSNYNYPIINKSFERITGRTKEELIELGWGKITHPDDVEEDLENYNKFLNKEISSYSMEKRYIKPDGSVVWVNMIVTPITNESSVELNSMCLVQDITERKTQEVKLKYISQHDSLTNLYNRRYFEEILNREKKCKNCNKRAIILLNLKNLNFINLTYGYSFSEKIIKELAKNLLLISNDNTILFHISFERFVFYIKDYSDSMDLSNFCDCLSNVLKVIRILDLLVCNIGILEIKSYDFSAESILRKAMIAADKVKEHKAISYIFFDEYLEKQMIREDYIKDELISILYNKNNENLYLQYQPIIDLKTNRVKGFEALARLKSGNSEIIPPIEFIPIAEEIQLIVSLGQRVALLACKFLKKLEVMGYIDVNICINISITELFRDEFVSDLLNIIDKAKINPCKLEIEITETVFSSNHEIINSKLEKLMEFGIRVSIDDFGTGYSSLSRERELKVNCLKIDKLFIDKLLYLKPEEAITGDIISMAHKLGHVVVAEGVEHEKQKEYLINNHCDLIQGYLFSKPLDEEDAVIFLKKTNL